MQHLEASSIWNSYRTNQAGERATDLSGSVGQIEGLGETGKMPNSIWPDGRIRK